MGPFTTHQRSPSSLTTSQHPRVTLPHAEEEEEVPLKWVFQQGNDPSLQYAIWTMRRTQQKKGKSPSTTTPSVDSFEKVRRFSSDGARAKLLEPTALDDERGVKDVLAGGGRMVEHFKRSQLAAAGWARSFWNTKKWIQETCGDGGTAPMTCWKVSDTAQTRNS